MCDEYDNIISNYDYTIDVYQNDDIEEIISKFINKIFKNENKNIEQFKKEEYLSENIANTINKLQNALNIFESRIITNIGGKVAFNQNQIKTIWILVQVHRGVSVVE